MIHTLIYVLIFLIPPVGMLGGLSVATTIPLLLILQLWIFKDTLHIYSLLKESKIEILFFLWCLISCIWSTNHSASLLLYFPVFIILLMGIIVNNYADSRLNLATPLIFGIVAAIVLFFTEYFTQGIISKNFRMTFQPNSHQNFHLYFLDRGCALLALTSWVIMGLLIRQKKYIVWLIFSVLVTYLLYVSDSLASFLGFIIGTITLIISKLLATKSLRLVFFRLISIAIILGSILMPIFAYKIDPQYFAEKYTQVLPTSAKHRLFIWHFVASKIIEKPIIGYGFGGSRNVIIEDKEIIRYSGHKWSPLPMHPHNNIMQIVFETGIVGLMLFLTLVYKYLKKIYKMSILSTKYSSVLYACFVNYYIIGMISYSMWQLWWIAAGIFSITMINLLLKPTENI